MRDLERPGRSPVHALNGMAATSQPLATECAIDVLRQGGNALDAAVAACAVQCVVEPASTGIGGDCFCLYAPAGGTEIIAYNGSGRAPGAVQPEWYRDQGMTEIARNSAHSVTIPGAVEAWDRLVADHGRKPLNELLQPAIKLAREGYPVGSRTSRDIAHERDTLTADPALARTFLREGEVPSPGQRLAQPALAQCLERIAAAGRRAFYEGPVAEEMVAVLKARGGLQELEDFAGHRGEYVTPIASDYRGYRVHQCPPNGQGVIALLLLKILEPLTLGESPLSPERIHLEIEAGRLAYRERDAGLADPAMAEVPQALWLSDACAAELRARIRPDAALPPFPAQDARAGRDTVYISVVDRDRNACSFINSLYYGFGSGIYVPNSGVVLHNRGMSFALDPEHPNGIAPGKRPRHTLIPGLVSKEGRIALCYGVMGGEYQAFGHMQFLTRFLDYGLDLQEAQDLARFFPHPFKGATQYEAALPQSSRRALESLGHRFLPAERPIGGSQAISIDWREGVLTGASDPRKDGCALGY